MKGKVRQANIELLRITAMIMVVMLHYFVKGGAEVSLVENTGAVNLLTWAFKGLCVVTINVYILISGYFLLEARWKISRVITLWLQMYVYSVGIPVVCYIFGLADVREWGIYDWINVIFPVQMEHYWFVTAYIIMYFFAPLLSAGVKQLTKKQHQLVIGGLLLIFSVPKTILPVLIPTDQYGYDFGWFLCLFVIAAYIRMYGIPILSKKSKAFAVYIGSVALMWMVSVLCGILSRKGLPLDYMMDMVYCYNYFLVLVASVGLFYTFQYIRIPEGKVAKLICGISPYVLGVYLLHENIAVRNMWPFWFGIEKVRDSFAMFPHMFITVVAVFIAGVMIDFVRDCIFKFFIRTWKKAFAGKTAK